MQLGRSKKTRKDWNLIEHISSWFMLMIIYLGENINTTNEEREALLEARSEVGLEVNTEKAKYMVVSHHQNVGQITIY
jgi:hypothetical protein